MDVLQQHGNRRSSMNFVELEKIKANSGGDQELLLELIKIGRASCRERV